MCSGVALGQGPFTAPPAPPLPPTGQPGLGRAEPYPVGRVMTFQKPAGDKEPAGPKSAPIPPDGLPKDQVDPKQGLEAGKAVTGPGADPAKSKFEGAVNRSTAFRLVSDAQLNRRIVDELVRDVESATSISKEKNPAAYTFPESQPVAPKGTQYVAKTASYPPNGILIEPAYVTHRRLYFEDRNVERYGWDAGVVQTLLSAGAFYKDVFLFPAYFASHPHERYETSAGKCRPGDPVPYFLYPPEIDIWGYAAQASTLVGAGFIFPY